MEVLGLNYEHKLHSILILFFSHDITEVTVCCNSLYLANSHLKGNLLYNMQYSCKVFDLPLPTKKKVITSKTLALD